MSRIERIEISHHRLELDPPFAASWDPDSRRAFPVTVIQVVDTDGRVGFGAGDAARGLLDYLDLFVGTDPLDLDRHSEVLANISFLDGRPWVLDTALWELAGRIRGQSIWKMLGGREPSVALYASTGTHRNAEPTVELARTFADVGFAAIKLRLGRSRIEEDLEVVAAVRSEVDLDVLVDCNQGWRMPWDVSQPWTRDMAAEVAERLAELGVAWMEEPLHRGDVSGYAWLRERSAVPIAGGEMNRELHELEHLVENDALDIYQPDVVTTGGFHGLLTLANRIKAAGGQFTPHTWGSGVALVANAHLYVAAGGGPYLEYPWDPPEWVPTRRDFFLQEPIEAVGGGLSLTEAPGLGVELDHDSLAATQTDSVSYG